MANVENVPIDMSDEEENQRAKLQNLHAGSKIARLRAKKQSNGCISSKLEFWEDEDNGVEKAEKLNLNISSLKHRSVSSQLRSNAKSPRRHGLDDSKSTVSSFGSSKSEGNLSSDSISENQIVLVAEGTIKEAKVSKMAKNSDISKSDKSVNADKATQGPNNDSQVVKSPKDMLLKALWLMRATPLVPLYRQTCHSLALMSLKEHIAMEAVYFLAEAEATTFRHTTVHAIMKKLRKLEKDDKSKGPKTDKQEDELCEKVEDMSIGDVGIRERLMETKTALSFSKTVEHIPAIIDTIPEDLTVCQVSVIGMLGGTVDQLVITRLNRGQPPVAVTLPGFTTANATRVLKEFSRIMTDNNYSMKVTAREEWWSIREALDASLCTLLTELENGWLDGFKGLLIGIPKDEKVAVKLAEADIPELKPEVTRTLLLAWHQYEEREKVASLHHLFGDQKLREEELKETIGNIIRKLDTLSEDLNIQKDSPRHPVVLILDKTVQHLPWESLPILAAHPVTRLPSLYFLDAHIRRHHANLDSVATTGINPTNVYYILNPDNNLPNTQETFESWFKEHKEWKGIVAQKPTPEEFTAALAKSDLFIYCGHGSGSKYVSGGELQQADCHAAVLVMGCSGGKLTVNGQLDPAGVMLTYLAAGTPSGMSCLWDVTDRDIDRFTDHILRNWLAAPPGTPLLDFVPEGRTSCKLSYLVGASVVTYGFPVKLKQGEVV